MDKILERNHWNFAWTALKIKSKYYPNSFSFSPKTTAWNSKCSAMLLAVCFVDNLCSVCNFYTTKLLFRRNNRIWCKGLVFKSSRVASNQVIQRIKWYNKRLLTKAIQFHGTLHGLKITNCVLDLGSRQSGTDIRK